jgi:tetratricopeptide (TPR) repeat protein
MPTSRPDVETPHPHVPKRSKATLRTSAFDLGRRPLILKLHRLVRRVTLTRWIYTVLALLLCVRLYIDVTKPSIIVDPIRVPDALRARGYSAEVLTDQVMDRLRGIETEVTSFSPRERFSLAGDATVPDFEVPATKLSYRNIVQILQGVLHREPLVVSGDVELLASEPAAVMHIRVSGRGDVRTGEPIKVPSTNIATIQRGLAESILDIIDPPLLAVHVYMQDRDYARALALTDRPSWTDPNPAWVRNVRGVILLGRMKKYADADPQVAADSAKAAKAEFQAAINIAPHWGTPFVNLGNLLADMGRPSEAIEQYQAAISHDSSNVRAYFQWAKYLGDKEGKKKIEEAVSDHPKSALAHAYFADALAERKELEAAAREYDAALTLEPLSASMYRRKADFLTAHSNETEALALYEKAASLEPQVAGIYSDWATALYRKGDWMEALEKSVRALEIEPHSEVPFGFLSTVGSDPEQCDEAVRAFKDAKNPQFAADYSNWAIILHENHKDFDALAKFNTAQRLNPRLTTTYLAAAHLFADENQFADVTRMFKMALALQPNNASIYKQWGDMLADHERWKEAIHQYRMSAMNIRPSNRAEIYFALSRALDKAGNTKEATIFSQKASELQFSDFPR